MKVRHPQFYDGTELDKYWFGGNPFSTHLVAAYNVLFPDGEMYFIRSVNKHKKHITDAKLKEEVRIFVGQEAEHMFSTRQFLDSFIPFIKRRTKFIHTIWVTSFTVWEKVMNFFLPTLNLSITAAMEQYTAIFAEAVYDKKLWRGVPEHVIAMHRWHMAEEIEHKAVAFDVMRARGVGYPMRILGFIMGSIFLFGYATFGTFVYLLTDWEMYRRPLWSLKQFAFFIRDWADCTVAQIPLILMYFKPSYHPDMVNHPEGAIEYLNTPHFEEYGAERPNGRMAEATI